MRTAGVERVLRTGGPGTSPASLATGMVVESVGDSRQPRQARLALPSVWMRSHSFRASQSSVLFVLVLTLAVAVSAQTLSIQKIAGRDGVNGFIRENDVLRVDALAQIPGDDTIRADQVRVDVRGITYLFSSCAPQSGGFSLCVFSQELSGSRGQSSYAVSLFNDDGVRVSSKSQVVSADVVAPEVRSVAVTPQLSSSGNVSVQFVVEDYAFRQGDTSVCSGLSSIDFWEGGVGQKRVKALSGDGSCRQTGSFLYTTTALGAVQLCAVASDRFNQSSTPACVSFAVDRKAPVVKDVVRVTESGTNVPVLFIRSAGGSVDVAVDLDGADVDPASVVADLERLTGVSGDVRADSVTGTEVKTAVWSGVDLSGFKACSLVVKARDLAGNAVSKPLTCSVRVDDTSPVVESVNSLFSSSDGLPLVSRDGVLFVTFKEDGSGFGKREAYLDLSNLGLSSSVRSDNCSKVSGTQWVCVWSGLQPVSSGSGFVSVLTSSRDDLGNALAVKNDTLVRFDAQGPRNLRFVNVSVLHGQLALEGNVTVRGDTIEFFAEGVDVVAARANFSALGGIVVPGVCQGGKCFFSQIVRRSGPYQARLKFDFFDDAGNKGVLFYDLFVYGLLNDSNPNYWSSSVICSPRAIDRSTTALINHRAYCQVMLTGPSNAEPVAIQFPGLGDCSSDVRDFVEEARVVNNQPGSRTPVLALTLATSDFAVDSVEFTCPLFITSRVGGSIAVSPEREDVPIKMQFYNNPLGELNGELDAKIKDAKEATEGFLGVIGTLKTIMDVGQKICQYRTVITNGIAAIDSIVQVFDVLSASTAGVLEVERQELCHAGARLTDGFGSDEGLFGAIGQMCSVLNCRAAKILEDDEGITKVAKGIGGGALLGPWANSRTVADTYSKYGVSGLSRVDVKDSLVWSVASFCVPGIIYNVDKYRQIQCRYAVCLRDEVKGLGLPVSVCEDEKAFMACNFVWNQVFAAIPWLNVYNYWMAQAKEIVSNPAAAVAAVIGQVCEPLCAVPPLPTGSSYSLCAIPKALAFVGQTIEDVITIKDEGFFKLNDGWCEQLEEGEERSEKEGEGR